MLTYDDFGHLTSYLRGKETTTFVGGLRLTGFTAPLVIDGPRNGQLFLAYVQQQLAPTLE